LWDQTTANGGAANKLDLINHYYMGEVGTTIVKCSLKVQGREVLLVSTITGAITALVPTKSKEEITFFQHLEMYSYI
jgi:splicing factor 3B subunit 3